jgi:hypothetical protein
VHGHLQPSLDKSIRGEGAGRAATGLSVDQYRDLGMREYLDHLASEDERGDVVTVVRSRYDKITTLRICGFDGLGLRFERATMEQLTFESSEEALAHGVVMSSPTESFEGLTSAARQPLAERDRSVS